MTTTSHSELAYVVVFYYDEDYTFESSHETVGLALFLCVCVCVCVCACVCVCVSVCVWCCCCFCHVLFCCFCHVLFCVFFSSRVCLAVAGEGGRGQGEGTFRPHGILAVVIADAE